MLTTMQILRTIIASPYRCYSSELMMDLFFDTEQHQSRQVVGMNGSSTTALILESCVIMLPIFSTPKMVSSGRQKTAAISIRP